MRIKNIRILLLIFSVTLLSICLSACDNNSIKLNGDFEETTEVNTNYTDLGISCSSDYNVITEGEVNTNYLGRYQIKYKIYTKDGELVKELSRYVNVVDTTAPTYVENKNTTFYVGVDYHINDFITYTDNYDDNTSIQTDFATTSFTSEGSQLISIKLKDSSNNENIYTKRINVVFDLDKLVKSIYKNQPDKITTTTSESVGTYTRVQIDSNTSFTYYESGSVHFIKNFNSSFGYAYHALIQISATKYNKFNNANVDYHVSAYPDYSTGWAYLDVTKNYSSLSLNSFRSTINNLNLSESDMLNDCNNNLLNVVNAFQNYMTNVLHVELK